MRIVIAGGGVGGFSLAGFLANSKHQVTIFESSESLDSMRYDWHDDASPKVFNELGIAIPEGSHPKNNCLFVSPFNKGTMYIEQPKEGCDLAMERRPLNKILYDRINPENVIFGAKVTKAIVTKGAVTGCEVVYSNGNKEKIFCDLLIDSAGAQSSVRKSLPPELHIQNIIPPSELFYAYRGFFNKAEGVTLTDTDNKVYMKHLGEQGISWCFNNHDKNSLNVLIGRIGELKKDTMDKAMADIRKDNKGLGNNLLRGGGVYCIPVRRPLSRLVANGYAAIGDCACMTIPMIGSGIASSITAAKILANVLANAKDAKIETLWKYNYEVFKAFGVAHCGVDYTKRWMLKQSNDMINWLFTSGILAPDDLQQSSSGATSAISPKALMKKLAVGLKSLSNFGKVLSMLTSSKKAGKIGDAIPEKYDEAAINAWEQNLEKQYAVFE